MSNSSSRSAFEAIPGKDALLEYQSKSYPAKTYVEKDGLVYKSLTATSNTFLTPQWELIADLREVRVPNISSRNALTGNTPTSGTTGIRIPILDNTNVLVLNAIGDPQVAANKFARYNYNKVNGTWLLLQVGTGATNSNVSNYQLLTNKPAVVSGITVNVGGGLTGGGSVLGTSIAPYAAGGTITVSHADTSSQANINNSGYAYVQQLRFDTYGHVTGATSSTWVHPATSAQASVTNSGFAYIQSVSLDANGHVSGLGTSTWAHPDTSTQADSNNSGNVFIQSIFLDGAGHVTGIATGTASGGGGGGSPLKYNGDFGGVLTMNSGGTLTISGGTNIATIRTGNATNAGLRINLLPAGATTQVQFNNSGFLGASANFTYNTATNILTSPNINLSAVPATGTLGDNIVVRNTITGAIQTIPNSSIITTANNGLNKVGTNVRLGGVLTGDTIITGGFGLNFMNNYWTFGGARNAGTVGAYSIVVGQGGNVVSGLNSSTFGVGNVVSGIGSHSFGYNNVVSGDLSITLNANNNATGIECSTAIGRYTMASGSYTLAAGRGSIVNVTAAGQTSFNFSENNGSQTAGHGALAANSAILGGINHNVNGASSIVLGGQTNKLTSGVRSAIIAGASNTITAVSADGSVIIGGQTNLINDSAVSLIGSAYNAQINTSNNSLILGGNGVIINSGYNIIALGINSTTLTNTYDSHTIVNLLAIRATPTTSISTDFVLAWNSTDKKVKLGTISSTSDIRLKKDFSVIEHVVDKISTLDAYEYTNNDVIKPMEGIKNYGLTAQQVEKVFPHVVKDNYDYEGEVYKTVDYRHLVPVLFAAIKELNEKIKKLESKI